MENTAVEEENSETPRNNEVRISRLSNLVKNVITDTKEKEPESDAIASPTTAAMKNSKKKMAIAAKAFLGMQVSHDTWVATTAPTLSLVIHPQSTAILLWNIALVIVLLFIAITLPIRFADILQDGVIYKADYFVDIFFIVDLIINFFVGYINDDGLYVGTPKKTALHYFKTRFFFDLVTSIPGSFFPVVGNAAFIPTFIKLLRLSRMLKLVALFQKSTFVESVFNPAIVQLVKLLLGVALAAHFGGSFFWSLKKGDPDLQIFLQQNNLQNGGPLDYYVASLYYAVATLTTVGYGDIVPRTTQERAYSLGLMLSGAMVFATILSNIAEVIATIDRTGAMKKAKLSAAQDMMRRVHVTHDFRHRVKAFYEHKFRSTWLESDVKIVEELPTNLRLEMGWFMCRGVLARHALFRGVPKSFLGSMMMELKPVNFKAGSVVFAEGDRGECLYIIITGSVEVFSKDNQFLMELKAGAVFGEGCVYVCRQRTVTVVAKADTELFSLHYVDVNRVLNCTVDANVRSMFKSNCAHLKETYRPEVLMATFLKKAQNEQQEEHQPIIRRIKTGFLKMKPSAQIVPENSADNNNNNNNNISNISNNNNVRSNSVASSSGLSQSMSFPPVRASTTLHDNKWIELQPRNQGSFRPITLRAIRPDEAVCSPENQGNLDMNYSNIGDMVANNNISDSRLPSFRDDLNLKLPKDPPKVSRLVPLPHLTDATLSVALSHSPPTEQTSAATISASTTPPKDTNTMVLQRLQAMKTEIESLMEMVRANARRDGTDHHQHIPQEMTQTL